MEAEGRQPVNLGSPTEASDFPPISIQRPSAPSPFDKNCGPSQAPTMGSGCLDHLSYDQLRQLCRQHANYRKGSTRPLKTRLASTQDRNSSSKFGYPSRGHWRKRPSA